MMGVRVSHRLVTGVVMVVKWVVLPVLAIAMCGWELLKGGPMALVL